MACSGSVPESCRVLRSVGNFVKDRAVFSEIPDPWAGVPGAAGRALPGALPSSASRRSVWRTRALLSLLGGICIAAQLVLFGFRFDLHDLSAAYAATLLVLPSLLGLCCLGLAAAPGALGLGLSSRVLVSAALLGPASFGALALAVPAPHGFGSERFWHAAAVCAGLASAWAVLPLLIAAASFRHAFAAASGWRSALLGGGVGLCVGAAIDLHCPNVDPAHLCLGHAAPVVLVAACAALALARFTRS